MSNEIESIQVCQDMRRMGGSFICAMVTTVEGDCSKVCLPSKSMLYFCDMNKDFGILSKDLSLIFSGVKIFEQDFIDNELAEYAYDDFFPEGINGVPSVSLAISLAIMKLGAKLMNVSVSRYMGGVRW